MLRRVALSAVVVFVAITTVVGAVPPAPAHLTAVVNGSSVTLTWSAPPAAITGYRIEAGTAPGWSDAATAVIGDTTSVTASDVPAGTYYVRIRAIGADGESRASNEVVVVVGGGICRSAPAPPSNLTPTVNGWLIALSWSPSPGCSATGYTLHAGSFPGGSDIAVLSVGGVVSFSASAPPGRYHVYAVAVNTHGASAPSNVVTIHVSDTPAAPPNTPAPPPNTPAPPPNTPAPPPNTPAPPPNGGSGGSVRIMTWNIQHGKRADMVPDLMGQVRFMVSHSPDVLLLQEVQTWDEDQPSRLKALLEQQTGVAWHLQWAPVTVSRGTEGNAVLTRLPVTSSTYIQMHATSDWTTIGPNRSAAQATILVGGVSLYVFSTHLEYYNANYRSAHLQELLPWVAQFGPRRILGGDLNSLPSEWFITTVKRDYHDTWEDVTGSSEGGHTRPRGRIDYLFRSKAGSDHVRPTNVFMPVTTLSDHNPVIADYTVVP
jgi:endonuclease/exonuclease/phosphatase family metal-dependent hydrolase